MAEAEGDEDDVVREVDVVLCCYPDLFLAQFPLKPVYAEPPNVLSARFKPENRVLEMKVPLFRPAGSDTHPGMDEQRYSSTEVGPASALGAAFISNNTMYISPLEGVLQMRPNLKQFHDVKTENIEMSMDMDADEDEMEQEGPSSYPAPSSSMQQVQLKRKESEKAQSARLQSYSHLKQQEEGEMWRNLTVYPIGELHYSVLPLLPHSFLPVLRCTFIALFFLSFSFPSRVRTLHASSGSKESDAQFAEISGVAACLAAAES